jgi:hypothetical protein
MQAATDLTGLWSQEGTTQTLDDTTAIARGHIYDGQAPGPPTKSASATELVPGPHGTYVRIPYYRIYMSDKNPIANAVLDIFADDGTFGRFISSDGTDNWEFCADPVDFTAQGGTLTASEDLTLTRYPTLVLDHYTDAAPSGANVGDAYIGSAGDGWSAMALPVPAQRLTYNATTKQVSLISDADPDGVLLYKVPQIFEHEKPGGTTFDDTFHGQVNMAQLQFVFYGFYPPQMEVTKNQTFSAAMPGTSAVQYPDSNPAQHFTGQLIFQFPAGGSTEYVRQGDVTGTPFFPLGATGNELGTGELRTHSETLKTVSDRLRSWSVTLGFSAGIEGVFDASSKLTYGSKIEEQQTQECRYTVSRKVNKDWVELADMPSLRLHDTLMSQIKNVTAAVLADPAPKTSGVLGQTPAFKKACGDFVKTVGTHYAHAITQGEIEITETHFSLDAESTAVTNNIDLGVSASVVVDGIKAGTDDEYKAEWMNKTGIELSTDDVTTLSVGAQHPPGHVAIFFDLRPISELLSPMFLQHDPNDEWLRYAPWLWTVVRAQLDAYLETLGLNKPMDPSFLEDYSPHKFKVTVPSINVTGDALLPDGGTVTLRAHGDPDADCLVRKIGKWTCPSQGEGEEHRSVSLPQSPDPSAFYLTALVTGGSENPVILDMDVDLVTIFPHETEERPRVAATFQFTQTVELPRRLPAADGTGFLDQDQPRATVTQTQGNHTLEIQVIATDVGLDYPDLPRTIPAPTDGQMTA